MLESLRGYLLLALSYIRLNFRSQLEYRSAFVSQIVAMFINDFFWLGFWVLFFKQFPTLRGWTAADVVTLWAVVASGFGLGHGLLGNALVLPRLIMRGELDTWRMYPRALLSHLLLGSMHVSAWGDVLFGVTAYTFFVRPDALHFVLFLTLMVTVAVAFVGFSIMTGSLAFFVGNGEALAEQWRFALLTFSTYPPSLFDGLVRVLLYTVIPAAFCGYLPVEALRNPRLETVLLAFLGSAGVLAAGTGVFQLGMRRYESGNLLEMRG